MKPTTYALTATGKKIAVIRWVKNWGGKYTPEVRCQEVSAKFQSASEQGLLKYLTYGIKSGQKVICVAGEYGGPCLQVLFTLRSNDDPDRVLQDMMSVGFRAQGPVVQSEDGSPQYYYDFEQFLEKATTAE
ncbi:COP23 domain-containing protein [Microcystis aeruginosa CS-555/01A07]|uniref:COP23 domain-containing protein n=1 Tax=Microcystis aeruginosa TaxID=1126 RepID=UPI00232B5A96|nr:COP23 domain-containing protein [Microcystis aeruginosa]MDB9431182.1 COP23 domain-containing protein [Microcystis aeruginosa CS-555/01A07]